MAPAAAEGWVQEGQFTFKAELWLSIAALSQVTAQLAGTAFHLLVAAGWLGLEGAAAAVFPEMEGEAVKEAAVAVGPREMVVWEVRVAVAVAEPSPLEQTTVELAD